MWMLFKTFQKNPHVIYIMLTISIKCHDIFDFFFTGILPDPRKTRLHSSSSTAIYRMANIGDFVSKSFFEHLPRTINRAIIYNQYFSISCIKNTLDNAFDSTSFIVSSDEKKKLIFLHGYHGEQVREQDVSALPFEILFL